MRIESTEFTMNEVDSFIDEMQGHDRDFLADRLERASARLAQLAPSIKLERIDGQEWSTHEILAHIAVLSKFYGVLVHKISSGQMTELNLLENVNLRDVAGNQLSELDPAELLRMALADQARTLKLLRTVEPSALRRQATLENGERMSAEQVARLPLVNHLEMHVDQLERAVSAG